MNNFSDIKNDFGKTNKVKLMENFSVTSGLPMEHTEKLYESFSYSCFGDLDKINESFTDFLKPQVMFDFDKFKNNIIELTNFIGDVKNDESKKEMATNKLLGIIKDAVDGTPNTPLLLEIICFVLSLKNRDKMKQHGDTLMFGSKMMSLFENESNFKIDNWSKLNLNPGNIGESDIANKEDIRLYNNLKVMLSKNNNRWGYNYHIDNVYKAILEYLNEEIEQLTNDGNVNSINSYSYDDFMKSIIQDSQLNIIYNNVDSLKLLIPDLQTLLYDLIYLVDYHIQSNIKTNGNFQITDYFDNQYVMDYMRSRNQLLQSISSSQHTSKLSYKGNMVGNSDYYIELLMDQTYMQLSLYGIKDEKAEAILQIIKSVQNEFNLKIRKQINVYMTKSREYLYKIHNIRRRLLSKSLSK